MAKTWDERLANLSVKLDELSKKAAAASEDAKVYRELRKEAINEKITTAKGNVAAMQENVRLAEEERQGKIRSALLKARMTVKAKHEDRKDARDKRFLEEYLDRLLEPFRTRKVDAVVLGCTHYVFLRRAIAAHFPPGTAIVDGNLGTAKQLARRLKETGLEASRDAEGTVRIYSSGGEESLKIFRRLYEAEDEA